MTKRVQLAGSDQGYDIENFLVGLERELRVDISNQSLRLHDGVKEGGYEFFNRDTSDNRYQFHSAELDGFVFGAQEKGLLVRTGPAQYKIRKVISSETDIKITNPRGTAGDFDLNLAAVILTAHTWSATQTFQERIVADDGITGDSFGTHHGDVIGNVTGDLTGNANGDATGSFTGDVDVRGHTILFDDGQIPEEALDPTILINRGVPIGAILMWSGTVDTIPESWALCDGNDGTPDLRSRFIIGAGVGGGFHAPLASGGSTTISLTGGIANGGAHDHTGTTDGHELTVAEMPSHSHTVPYSDLGSAGSCIENAHGTPITTTNTNAVGGGAAHSHDYTTPESGSHSHDLTLDDVGILPPFYALCFIMKTV